MVAKRYGQSHVAERHRHRYEVNNTYRERLEDAGLVISGTSPDSKLVEFIELPTDLHPYFVATQAHPELKSRPTRPHPLFIGLVEAALDRKLATRLPVDERPSMIILGPDELADVPLAWPVVSIDRARSGQDHQLCARSGTDARRAADRAGIPQASRRCRRDRAR